MIAYQRSTHDFYNGLPPVELAAEITFKRGLVDKMKRIAAPIFNKHGAGNYWAVSLLHCHWYVDDDTFAGETSRPKGPFTEFIMRPTDKTFARDYVPCLFAFTQHGLQGLEYSAIAKAKVSFDWLSSRPDFVSELGISFEQTDLAGHFGLSVVRDHDSTKQYLVERTEPGPLSRLSPELDDETSATNLIETTWGFREMSAMNGCIQKCFPQKGGGHRMQHKGGDD